MKRIASRLLIMVMAMSFVVLNPSYVMQAQAKEYESADDVSKEDCEQWAEENKGTSKFDQLFKTKDEVTDTEGLEVVVIDNESYYYDPAKVTTAVYKQARGNQVSGDINNMVADMGIEADLGTASTLLSGVVPFVNGLLGVICTVISLGMFIFTALDVAYIVAPEFKETCDNAAASGNKSVSKQGSDGQPRFRWITSNAIYAINAANTVETGKSALWIYLKSRVVAFMILAVVLYILLTGNIGIFMNLGLKVADGIIKIIDAV